MRKFVKIFSLSMIILFGAALLTASLFVGSTYLKYSSLTLNEEKLSSPALAVELYDFENRPLKEENTFNGEYAKISTLPDNLKNAFISIEDKSFYSHHGLNYKRIIKAGINNVLSHSLKEGASTISQQLIKNTHLSAEKTFERKIKEIMLTRKLEKAHTKDEILECYLNVIYYGNNCYGIENAANYYFSKPASKLELEECALLAGMVKSPNKYSPILKQSAAIERRNLVLSEMQKDGYITEQQCLSACKAPITLNLQAEEQNALNSYSQAALDEACQILKVPAKTIAINGYKIHTYLDKDKQQALKQALSSEDFNCADHAAIVLDCNRHAITAYQANSAYKVLDAKRQPGSIIKPIIAYAPALNEDIISPSTQILDEQLALGEYNPKNVDGKFRGYVSATEALSKSINIPAIKVLSYVGMDKAKAYAESMGLEFDELDNSYALALGGMRYGVNLKQVAQSYSTFANNGMYDEAKFVEYITDASGKIIYHHKPKPQQVLREDATYLLTTMLQDAAATGTAKALKDLAIPIAAKTGTVGKGKDNIDAWCAAYTPKEVCVAWVGNLDNSPITVAGGNQPTRCVKNYFQAENATPSPFTQPASVVEREIDLISLENMHKLELASPSTPARFKQTALFSIFNLPKDVSQNFVEVGETKFDVKSSGSTAEVCFTPQRHLTYCFYDGKTLLKQIAGQTQPQQLQLKVSSGNLKITVGFDEKNLKTYEFKLKKEAIAQPQNDKWFI